MHLSCQQMMVLNSCQRLFFTFKIVEVLNNLIIIIVGWFLFSQAISTAEKLDQTSYQHILELMCAGQICRDTFWFCKHWPEFCGF